MTPRSTTATANELKKEIDDILVRLKWSELGAAAISDDEIDSKDFLSSLTKADIAKLYFITRKPGGREYGHKVSMITEDHIKLALYWAQH